MTLRRILNRRNIPIYLGVVAMVVLMSRLPDRLTPSQEVLTQTGRRIATRKVTRDRSQPSLPLAPIRNSPPGGSTVNVSRRPTPPGTPTNNNSTPVSHHGGNFSADGPRITNNETLVSLPKSGGNFSAAKALRTTNSATPVSHPKSGGNSSTTSPWRDYHSGRSYVLRAVKDPPVRLTPTLGNTPIPRIVYYVWCAANKSRQFEFKHYLSLKSAIYFINPSAVFVLYDKWPTMGRYRYNTWLQELTIQYPFVAPTMYQTAELCHGYGSPNWAFVSKKVAVTGGVYVGDNTVLTRVPKGLSVGEETSSTDEGGKLVYSVMKPNGKMPVENPGRCSSMEGFELNTVDEVVCLHESKPVFPRDIWDDMNQFQVVARTVMYGVPTVPKPAINSVEVIPRVAHYFWFGGGKMDFLFYLSVLSCLHVLDLNTVYIHGDLPPGGKYWHQVAEEPRVQWIYRARTSVIFDHRIGKIAHEADVAAADVIVQYGGMHVDPDLVFTQPLPESIWRYDAVAGPSQANFDPFPLVINWGVFLGRPQAAFWRMVQRSERDYKDKDWNWNSARLLYKIYERNPDLLVLDMYLQVQCWHLVCTPRWPGSRQAGMEWHHNISQWMDSVYSFHFTAPTPQELTSAKSVRSSSGAFADIGRIVLRAAGLY